MVLAEAVKLDAGAVLLILLVVLGALLVTGAIVAWLGTAAGLALGRAWSRRTRPEVAPEDLPRGSRAWLVVGAVAATVLSAWLGWLALGVAGPGRSRSLILEIAAASILPVVWGAANGFTRSFPPKRAPHSPPGRPPGHSDRPDVG